MKHARSRKQRQRERRGAITVLAAICLILVIAFMAFSIDFGYITVTESEMQNAADAGALSGAKALNRGREAAIAAALKWAGKNIDAIEDEDAIIEEDVEIGFWDEELATFTVLPEDSTTKPNAVKVTCRRDTERGNPLQLFFAPLLGTNYANVQVSAIAMNQGSSCGGIMALVKIYLNDRNVGRASYTDSYFSNKGGYDPSTAGYNGDICTNGHLTLNGHSYVHGDARWWEGANDPNADASQVSGEFASFEEPIVFPEVDPGFAATINSNNKIYLSDNGKEVLVDGKFKLGETGGSSTKKTSGGTMTSGKYGTADSITLPPGTYYFKEMCVGSGSKVYVTGPTYIYCEGQIDLRFGGIDNTTKMPINLQIYPMGEDTYFYLPFFGQLHAAIYSTKAHIYLDEKNEPISFDFYGKMVGQKIRVWDTGLHVDESISFGGLLSGGEQLGKSGVSLVQ